MSEFLASNDWQRRLLRAIVQGATGMVIAALDLIMANCDFVVVKATGGSGGANE